MNKRMKVSVMALAVAGALGLVACGTGSNSTGATQPRSTTSGVITGFGSVFVNGVEYDTNGASVTTDGVPQSDDSALKVGMVVTLDGNVNADGKTGTATSINFADEVQGTVMAGLAAGATTGTINVMGQDVTITADTVFESNVSGVVTIDQVQNPNVVEVSGYSSGNGIIYATRVELKQAAPAAGEELELKGVVSGLDSVAKTFTLGKLVVDFSQAADYPSNIGDGLYVQVKSAGQPTGPDANGNYTLTASKVEVEGDGKVGHEGQEGEDMKLEGVITDISGLPNSIGINGQTVLLSGVENLDPTQFTAGANIKVEGEFNANGDLVASDVEMGREGHIEFQASVSAVDATAGTVTVLDQVIKVTATTTVQGDSANPDRYLNISKLYAGTDYVEVVAARDDTGALVATRLVRETPPANVSSVQLKGSVSSVTGTNAVVEGVSVDMTNAPVPLTTADVGKPVEVHGTSTAPGTITATEISM